MRCEWTYEELSAYVDGEMQPDEAERIRLHLLACSRCRRQVEAFRQLGTLVRAVPEVSPPADLRARVVALDAGLPVPSATCQQARFWLSQRADGELPHWQVPVLEQHLDACEDCRREADAVEGVISLVKALPEVNPPMRIRAAVHNAMARRAQARRIWRMGWTAATLGLAASAAVLLVTFRPGAPPRSRMVAEAPGPARVALESASPAPAVTVSPRETATGRATPSARETAKPARASVRPSGVRRLARAVGAVARALSPARHERAGTVAVAASTMGESVAGVVTAATAEMAGLSDPSEAMRAASQRDHVLTSEAALAAPPEEAPAAPALTAPGEDEKSKGPDAQAALAEAKQALNERPFEVEPIRVERKRPVVHVEY